MKKFKNYSTAIGLMSLILLIISTLFTGDKTVAASIPIEGDPILNAKSCGDQLIGKWNWSWGSGNEIGKNEKGKAEVTITADGKMSSAGNSGTWVCTAQKGTFTWSASVDTLYIKSSTLLEGTSDKGDWVKATKKDD